MVKISRFHLLSGLFLLGALAAWGATALVHPEGARETGKTFLRILVHLAPVMGLVLAVMFLTNLFVQPKKIKRWLGAGSGAAGWAISIAAGILSSGPIYFWYPVLRDLGRCGMKPALTAAFLYNRAIKIFLLPLLFAYFGAPYTAVLTVWLVVFSVINGAVTGFLAGGNAFWEEPS